MIQSVSSLYLVPVEPRHWSDARTGTPVVLMGLHCGQEEEEEEGETALHDLPAGTDRKLTRSER